MAAEDAEAPPPEEEAKKKEHEVSIVLSYMDDEHEKAAIEVRDGGGDDARSPPEGRPVPPPPTSARARNPHVPSHRSLLDAESFVRASDRPSPPRASHPLSPHLAAQEACAAFDKHAQYKDVAQAIKKGYDLRYPSSGKATDGVYHALVGKHFGASLSHETNQYVHLKVDLHDVIVFKSKDSPFDFDYDNLNKPAVEGGA